MNNDRNSVIRNFRITAADGKKYNTKHYNLSAIIAVGYKVNSERAVQQLLNEHASLDSFLQKWPESDCKEKYQTAVKDLEKHIYETDIAS